MGRCKGAKLREIEERLIEPINLSRIERLLDSFCTITHLDYPLVENSLARRDTYLSRFEKRFRGGFGKEYSVISCKNKAHTRGSNKGEK